MTMWDFANQNPVTAFMMVFLVIMLLRSAIRRSLRALTIWKHGWPTAPVDADGDVVTGDDEIADAVVEKLRDEGYVRFRSAH